MSDIFGHKYEIYIRKPLELIQVHQESTGYEGNVVALASPTAKVVSVNNTSAVNSSRGVTTSDSSGYSDYLTVDPGSVVIKDPIQMKASITYSNASTNGSNNVATISLFNLSKNTLSGIEKDCLLLLKAGYEKDSSLPIIFVGVIEKVSTHDNETTIVCKEGGNSLRSKHIVKKFNKGTTFLGLFISMMEEFEKVGIPRGSYFGNAATLHTLQEPLQVSGTLTEVMDKICSMLPAIGQMTWYVSGGKLHIHPKYDDRYVDMVDLKPSQIIGRVALSDENDGKTTGYTKTQQAGVKFTAYLNGMVRMENCIKIGYGDYPGLYKPVGIVYELDWKHGPWQMTVECKTYNGTQ